MSEAASTSSALPPAPPPLYRQLKPGPGLPAEEVVANQRGRILGAMLELAVERGYHQVTVGDLARAAGVSKTTFYSLYRDKEACFIATYDAVLHGAARAVLAGERNAGGGREGLRRGLAALAKAFATKPKAARLALIEGLAAGPTVLDHVSRRLGLFETLVADRFGAASDGFEPSPRVVRGIVAGVCHVARGCLLRGRPEEFVEHVDPLLDWSLAVAFGSESTLERRRGSSRIAAASRDAEPDGRHGSDRDEREIILDATIRLAGRDGYRGLSASRIRAAARVSRQSFDERFGDLPQCFLAAIATRSEALLQGAACNSRDATDWDERVRAGARSFCADLPADAELGRLAFVEVFAVGVESLRWREDLIASTARWIFRHAPAGRPEAPVAEASVAAAWVIVHDCIRRGDIELLPDQADLIAHLILAAAVDGAERGSFGGFCRDEEDPSDPRDVAVA